MKILSDSFKNGIGKDSVMEEEVLIYFMLFYFPLQHRHLLTLKLWLTQHSNHCLIPFIHSVFVSSSNKYFLSPCCDSCWGEIQVWPQLCTYGAWRLQGETDIKQKIYIIKFSATKEKGSSFVFQTWHIFHSGFLMDFTNYLEIYNYLSSPIHVYS